MNAMIVIEQIGIRQESGLYCLNDLHRAAGGERRHDPADWRRTQQTAELIKELEITGNPVIQSKQGVGTYVCRELVYAYAMWISPKFHLAVIRAFDAMQRQPAAPAIPQTLPEALRLAADLAEQNQQQAARLAIAEPKAAALDGISEAAGDLCLTDAAKTLGVAPRRLTDWMQAQRWIHKRNGATRWIAYQPKILSGYLRHVEHIYTSKSTGEERISSQVRVTAKGLTRLAVLLKREGAV